MNDENNNNSNTPVKNEPTAEEQLVKYQSLLGEDHPTVQRLKDAIIHKQSDQIKSLLKELVTVTDKKETTQKITPARTGKPWFFTLL